MITNREILKKEEFDDKSSIQAKQRITRKLYPKQQVFPLTKLIRCYYCGYTFSPNKRYVKGERDYLWRCMSRINNQSYCKCSVNLSNKKVEKIIWELIKKEHKGLAQLCSIARDSKINQIQHNLEDFKQEIEFQKRQKVKSEKNKDKAYSAFKLDAKLNPQGAQERLAETLRNIQVDLDFSNARIAFLEKKIACSLDVIHHHQTSDYSVEYIQEAEEDDSLKRKIFVELIKYIVPYPVRYRVVVLEVHTTLNSIIYVLFDANQKSHKVAHFVNSTQAIWQNSKLRLKSYHEGSFFVIPNTSFFMNTKGINRIVDFKQMQLICELNNQTIDYGPENILRTL